MTFMNKKEEVLDIKLTQYGKKLLSTGDFDPVYYTFHDEGVLYDSDYASFVESQNSIEGRILDDTPTLRTQHNFTSAKESGGVIKITNPDGSTTEIDIFQISQRSALGLPLGTSELNNQNFPAFKMKLFGVQITGTDLNYTGSLGNKIPQVNCKFTATAQVKNISDVQKYEDQFGSATSPIDPNGSYISMNIPDFLLEITEDNTDFNSENFDMEVFMEPSKENMPLSYSAISDRSPIVNGILIDLPSRDDNYISPTVDDMEFYFNIKADQRIPDIIIADAHTHFKSRGFYNDEAIVPIREGTTLEIVDIYSSTTDPKDIEDCD